MAIYYFVELVARRKKNTRGKYLPLEYQLNY